ncbi:unnamed protein product [Heligmosomoides polygyrus]|uniref:Transposase n=1 Tax=Heligmosomoides polygyrus TaxID=6339 RepID=A0A3P8AAI8_HELPZ|nr:unnamed protein product [Heligmosomoides polygyrus]
MAVIIVDAGEVFDTHGLAMAILSESVQILRFEFLVPFETVMSAPPLDLKLPHKTASRHRCPARRKQVLYDPSPIKWQIASLKEDRGQGISIPEEMA